MITAKDSDLQITQNYSHFKQLPDSLKKLVNKNENTGEHVDISEGVQHNPVDQSNQELTESQERLIIMWRISTSIPREIENHQ